MKKLSIIMVLLLSTSMYSNAQKIKKLPESKIQESLVEKHIRFLASDALLGRQTGEAGNNAAATYIAEEWRSLGLKAINGSYFQEIPFQKTMQPKTGELKADGETLAITKDFLLLNGGGIYRENAPAVHLPYAWVAEDGSYDDFKDVDVKGKVIICQIGGPDVKGFGQMLGMSATKEKMAKEKGAIALIEIFSMPVPWDLIVKNLGDGKIDVANNNESDFSRFLISATTAKKLKGDKLTIKCDALKKVALSSSNVLGVIEGADRKLKNEYIILSAHYDHIGHRAGAAGEDTIFNGARDNAIGIAGLLAAAKSLSELPPKRSVLFLAFTGEELGLKGSKYYAEHPLVPLNQCVFNFNIDGAGYDDMTKVTGIGIARTGAEAEIKKASEAMGLILIDDPVPEQGLFDRSDNVSFAAKGIPAPTFSQGFNSFSDEIMKYYHKEADSAESLDFEYCTKFVKAYAFAARLIADKAKAPQWVAGDKYEAAYKNLFKH